MTPPISLKALLEAEARATPGPWELDGLVLWPYDTPEGGTRKLMIAGPFKDSDRATMEFIAAARNAVRPLATALQEAIAALEVAEPWSHSVFGAQASMAPGVLRVIYQQSVVPYGIGAQHSKDCPGCAADAALAKIRERIAP